MYTNKYRQAGITLGIFIRSSNPSHKQIQGLLADLLANDEVFIPIRDSVSRPSFTALRDLARSGLGSAQRDAFLHELGRCYLPLTLESLKNLLDGMLGIPEERFNPNHTVARISSASYKHGTAFSKVLLFQQRSHIRVAIPVLVIVISASTYMLTTVARNEKTNQTSKITSSKPIAQGARTSKQIVPPVHKEPSPYIEATQAPTGIVERRTAKTLSPFEEAIALVTQRAPSIRQVLSNGTKKIEFHDLTESNDDCIVELNAGTDQGTHWHSVGFYKVDICNRTVDSLDTSRPEDFN